MTVGLLIVTHGGIGHELASAAAGMLGPCPLPTRILSVAQRDDPDTVRRDALAAVAALDEGAGVLVLTDAYGSTPSNIAYSLGDREAVRVVSGISLPMLLRVLNYPALPLEKLAEKAVSGGHVGIIDSGAPGG